MRCKSASGCLRASPAPLQNHSLGGCIIRRVVIGGGNIVSPGDSYDFSSAAAILRLYDTAATGRSPDEPAGNRLTRIHLEKTVKTELVAGYITGRARRLKWRDVAINAFPSVRPSVCHSDELTEVVQCRLIRRTRRKKSVGSVGRSVGRCKAEIPREQFPRSILVTSSIQFN